MSPKQRTQKSTKPKAKGGMAHKGLLSAEEMAAMKETLKERKTAANKEEAEQARACGDRRDEGIRSRHGQTHP